MTMPRTIEFDRDEALHRAMSVFWRQGYNATSIKDLTVATQLQPGSLYGTFHNKRALFVAALEAYFAETRQRISDYLENDGSPLERLRGFFDMLINESLEDPERKGCLLVNTLLEIPTEDAEINRRISAMFGEVEQAFERVLLEAQKCGELSTDKDPANLARMLVAGIYGLRVYHKTQPEPGILKEIVDNLFVAVTGS